ncbi:MAG: DUF481 domain-containing protein [Candidatus Sericytochromatia bacterium]
MATGLVALPALAVPVGTTPDTRPAAPQQRKQWQQQGISVNFSGFFLSGNVEMINTSGTLGYNYNLDKHQFFLDVGQLYTLAGSTLVANRLNGSLLYAYNLLDNLNLYGYSTHARDDSIKLDYRLTNGVGVCLHKILPDVFSLALISAGMAAENEWYKDLSSPFAVRGVLRLALARPLSDWAELGLDSFYSPVVNDFGDYRIYAEAYLKFQLNELLALKLSAADEYDSRPLTGVKNNDFGIFTTLSLDWGI